MESSIEEESLRFNELEHVLIEKVDHSEHALSVAFFSARQGHGLAAFCAVTVVISHARSLSSI